MHSIFRLGGAPMWAILVCGLFAIAASIRYAVRPERRMLPLVVSLGVLTLLTGAFGFVTGFVITLLHVGELPDAQRWIWMIGLGESLVDAAFALSLVVVAAIATSVGTFRVARAA